MRKITNLIIIAVSVITLFCIPQAKAAVNLSLSTSKTSANSGDFIPVNVNMDTSGNDVVVARAVIRYNPLLVSVAVTDVDLTNSIFNTGNTCVFPSDYTDVSLRGKSCQIISNDATNGILSITLPMPTHQPSSTNPGVEIKTNAGSTVLVATVNFHALSSIGSIAADASGLMGIQYIATGNYTASNVIADDGAGTDLMAAASPKSTVTSGDLNADRIVNIYDYSILHSNYNNNTCGNAADIDGAMDSNGNCLVTIYDYNIMHTNWNHTL